MRYGDLQRDVELCEGAVGKGTARFIACDESEWPLWTGRESRQAHTFDMC
jgi:hypothetical protein